MWKTGITDMSGANWQLSPLLNHPNSASAPYGKLALDEMKPYLICGWFEGRARCLQVTSSGTRDIQLCRVVTPANK